MKESLNNENVKSIDNGEENYNLLISSQEQSLKHYYSLNRHSTMKKFPSSLKLNLLKGIYYLDNHIKFFSFLKFFFGFIFLVLPLLFIIYIAYSDISVKNNYIFFPFFISACLIDASLLVFVVMKLNYSCRMFGILSLSYERIYNFKIIKFIFSGFFVIALLFICENFVINFNLLKEKVTQSKEKEITSKIFNEGTYLIRLLFIFLFWDLEKNSNNEYVHNYLGYFEYEDSFFEDFNKAFNKLLIPIMILSACGIVKIIFIKTKRGLLYSLLYLVILFFSSYSYIYDISNDKEEHKNETDQEYFRQSNNKYFEIIPITIIIIILIIINTKICIVDLLHKKYYSYKNKSRSYFVVFLVVCSYLFNTFGYLLFLFILYNLYLKKIDYDFSIDSFNRYWIMGYISLLLIFTGYSFPFGHYYFKLLYHSTAFEYYNHYKKNDFYINSSGNLIKGTGLFNKKKRMDKSFY